MGNFDYDNNSEQEWDDSWEANLNEFGWEQYLQREDEEVVKYRKLYNKLIKSQNRLDEVALFMGWETGNVTETDGSPESNPAEKSPEQPYTLHKHPLFVANKAIHSSLQDLWMQQSIQNAPLLKPQDSLQLQTSINQSDYYGQLAVVALDVGDYSLAIAYFKRGMSHINTTFSLLETLLEIDSESFFSFVKQVRVRLFDIRDVWLRVIADCRTAVAKKSEDDS